MKGKRVGKASFDKILTKISVLNNMLAKVQGLFADMQ
jgi:hypothetical protein